MLITYYIVVRVAFSWNAPCASPVVIVSTRTAMQMLPRLFQRQACPYLHDLTRADRRRAIRPAAAHERR